MCLFRVYGVEDGTVYSTSSSPSTTSSSSSPHAQLSPDTLIKNEPYYDQENGDNDDAVLPAEPECLLKFESEYADAKQRKNVARQKAKQSQTKTTSEATPGSSSSPHFCKYCEIKVPFQSFEDLVAHTATFHPSLCCLYCGKEFSSKSDLELHEYTEHGKDQKDKTTCQLCKKDFPAGAMEAHMKKHNSRFPCLICDRNFAYKNSLDRHIERKHRNVEKESEQDPKKKIETAPKVDRSCICELCGKLYKGPKGLSYHMLLHTGEHPHVCQQCGQAFIYKNSLTSHMIREHGVTSPYICSICGKVFLSKTALDDHERKHTGERPYACDVCNKAFSSKAHLSTHKYEHIETEMKCTLCEEVFMKRNDYYRHRARFHLPPRKKNHQCALCGVAVTSRKALSDHLRVHTKEKPFECDLCHKRFGQKDLVTMHIKSHLQIRPNKCLTCGKCFPNKQALVVHERIHTGERPHVCRVCCQSFNQINSLKRHLKLHNAKYHLCNFCGRDFDVKSELRIHLRNDHGFNSQMQQQ